ncbi:uncharacterized protein LOC125535013 isoform X3 [Triticum urartu]|uniref:uncharacterized protein LOC125535013 isoform X3 n=1 Tax=Triticum urartu TaxID=4572 RepID=UPI00204460C9|nr:uncharacterized protein LOC125535013 isoform X3 [Triticum urartu]
MEAKLLEQPTSGSEPSKLPYQLIKQITNDFDEARILGSGGFGTVYKDNRRRDRTEELPITTANTLAREMSTMTQERKEKDTTIHANADYTSYMHGGDEAREAPPCKTLLNYMLLNLGVYEDGRQIAVKVLHYISGVDDKEFHKEFDNLRGLKHPNIVELVGFCHEWEKELAVFEGKQVTAERLRMALCFEYVQQGSLNKHISDENTGFTWHIRYKIIKGICVGLHYLREGEHPIMHFDLKPDNILLDENMSPKIADFGLSKLFGEENTKKTMSSAGTCGYWPPEYIKHQIISLEFDIFSLGVIIVKIMNGHESYNSIVEMPKRKSAKLVHESWRKRLRGTLSHSSLEVYCNQVKRCIEIALDCLISNRKERPTIQDIVSSLNETETMIGDRGMQNEQFSEDDGESTLPSDLSSITISSGPSSAEKFPYVEPKIMPWSLLEEITDDFSEARLIGQGAHGIVYKGVDKDGHAIAVKMLHGYPFDMEIKQVIATIPKVHHPNIVQLIGYCHEIEQVVVEYNGKIVIADKIHNGLCFEYLPNGSLTTYITPDDVDSGLDWQTRYRIIKGTCDGLKYLHEGLKSPIIHMDLNPSHILMDENMTPKIAGFGSARLFGVENTNRTMSVLGTRGYIPPEFIEKQVISKEFGIFGLGIIILKLMKGQKSYHEWDYKSPEKFIELVAHEKWGERLQKAMDVTLVEGHFQQVKKCLEIAVRCVEYDRHKRPTIGEIVRMLNETETSLIPQIDSELLLHVHPLELTFMLSISLEVPRKKKAASMSSSCSLHLDNKGNDRVAFLLVANSPSRYLAKDPLCGVVPPRCAYTLILTMCNNKQQPLPKSSIDSGADFFTLHSVLVGQYELDKDTVSAKYREFFETTKEKAGHEVQEVTLNVICCQQQADCGTSSDSETITKRDAQQISSIDVHPMEPWIMTTHRSGSLRVWNYKTMATLNSIQDVTDESVHLAKFTAREKWIVAGDRSGCIHVHNYEKNEKVESFDAHNSCITTLAVHPTDPFVLSSSEDVDHLIKLWNWAEDWDCTEFHGHIGTVTQVTFDPNDSNSFASSSLDGTVKIWSICSDDPSKFITLNLGEHGLYVDYFTRNNQHHLVVGCKDRTAQIWKLETNERVHELEGHTNLISAANLHAELPILITGSHDGTVRIWNSTTYKLENIIGFNLGAVYAFGCIKGSRRIVVGCHHGIAMMDISLP